MEEDNSNTADEEPNMEMIMEQNPVLEQWKFYGQTTLNVSNRRLKNNRFYQRLLGATVAGVGVAAKLNAVGPRAFIVIGVVGVLLSLLWMAHIISYKQLNSGKYEVMNDIAEDLPNEPFAREWEILDRGRDPKTYVTHTSVEIWWPRVSLWVFGSMALYGASQLLSPALTGEVLAGWCVLTLIYWGAAFRGYKPFNLIAPFWNQPEESSESPSAE